jgi:dephospho-CoA kinase
MYVLGVTGGIGSGKNAVTSFFQEYNIEVVDADVASRRVVKPGMPALDKIADHFGAGVLLPSGELNRKSLRAIIFSDPEKRLWLEALLHPLIEEWIKQRLDGAQSPYVVLSSPLLFETKQHSLCNRILVIDVSKETQIKRTCSRDNTSEGQVRAIMANQMSNEKRLEGADDVIGNDDSIEALQTRVDDLHQEYLYFASKHSK